MSIISHTIDKTPSVPRKKPVGLDLSKSATECGPHYETHLEQCDTREERKWFVDGEWYGEVSTGAVPIEIPSLSASGIELEDAVSDTRKESLNRALAKLKDQRINLAVSLAELPETVTFLYDGVKAIVNVYKDLRSKEKRLKREYERQRQRARSKDINIKRSAKAWLRKMGRETDQIASLWLAFRYGVMPLVYDIQGAIEELQRPKEAVGDLIHVKTSKKLEEVKPIPWYMRIPQGDHSLRGDETLQVDVTYTVVLNCVVERPRSVVQLGITNGLELLWEVTPLSFVVDWALNIGESLHGLDAGVGTLFVSGTISEKRELKRTVGPVSRTLNGGHIVTTTGSGGVSYQKHYHRTVLSSLPSPQVYVSNNMNWMRMLDAFALLKTMFLKTK